MSLKSKSIIEKSFKIAIISLIILFSINLWFSYFSHIQTNQKIELNSANFNNYINSNIKPIAWVSIAISTNIWIQLFKRSQDDNISYIYNNIYLTEQILSKNKTIFKNIVWKNLLYIKDYYNFVKTDFNKTLWKTNNRQETLNSIINQLKFRLTTANKNAKFLLNQKNILTKSYQTNKNNIESIKNKIRKNYKNVDIDSLYSNMNEYYIDKNKGIILNTYILYIDDLLVKYLNLNKYNKILLNTLTLNKDIISKKSYIVIPKEWTQILKKYNLILTEEEYKSQKK